VAGRHCAKQVGSEAVRQLKLETALRHGKVSVLLRSKQSRTIGRDSLTGRPFPDHRGSQQQVFYRHAALLLSTPQQLAALYRMRDEVSANPKLFDPDARERIDEAIVRIQDVLRSARSQLMTWSAEQEVKAA